MTRRADQINVEWSAAPNKDGTVPHEIAQLEVMMDIREELRTLNRLLSCRNFTGIPATLRTISRNTAQTRKAKP